MIKSLTAINHLGEQVKITLPESDPSHGILVTDISGLGPAKANINQTDLVTADGGVFNSARLDSRNIVISLMFTGDIETTRNNTYKYFPIKREVELVVETDKKTLGIIGYVESNEPNIFSDQEGCSISVICPDPYFYDVGDYAIKKTIFSGIEPLFYFPFECNTDVKYEFDNVQDNLEDYVLDSTGLNVQSPKSAIVGETDYIEFGEIYQNPIGVVHYTGTIEIGCVIRLHFLGNVTDVSVYDITLNRMMSFTGPFKNGDDLVIDSRRGTKTVFLYRNGIMTNFLNHMSRDSEWFFLQTGDNAFSYTYTASTSFENVEFSVEYQNIYEGV